MSSSKKNTARPLWIHWEHFDGRTRGRTYQDAASTCIFAHTLRICQGIKRGACSSAIYFRVCRWVVFGITTKHCHRAKKRRWACGSWQRWPIFYCPSGFGLDFIALAGSSTIMLTVQDSRVVRLIPHRAESHKVFTVQSSPQLNIKSTFQNEYLQCVVDPLKLYFRGVLDPRTVVSRFRKGHERRR